jgi:hypothetical protein
MFTLNSLHFSSSPVIAGVPRWGEVRAFCITPCTYLNRQFTAQKTERNIIVTSEARHGKKSGTRFLSEREEFAKVVLMILLSMSTILTITTFSTSYFSS